MQKSQYASITKQCQVLKYIFSRNLKVILQPPSFPREKQARRPEISTAKNQHSACVRPLISRGNL